MFFVIRLLRRGGLDAKNKAVHSNAVTWYVFITPE